MARPVSKRFYKFLMKLVRYFSHNVNNKIVVENWRIFVTFLLNALSTKGSRYACFDIIDSDKLEDCITLKNIESEFVSVKPRFKITDRTEKFVCSKNNKLLFLKNISIVGGSNILRFGESRAICEQNFFNSKHNFYIRDPDVYADVCGKLILRCSQNEKTIKSGINLSGNGSYNFYHFMYEFIVKLMLVDDDMVNSDVPILVDEFAYTVPQFRSLLDKLNVSNREIVCLEKDVLYRIEECYHVNSINIISLTPIRNSKINFRDNCFNLLSFEYLRSNLLKSKPASVFPRKIFLSRKNATMTRDYNESDVIELFEKNGFTVVYPELLTIDEQIDIFNNAQFIAGPSGAAFSNLIFCSSSCKVLILVSSAVSLSVFSTIADYVGADLIYYSAKGERYISKSIHEKFHIDVDDFAPVVTDFFCDPDVAPESGSLSKVSVTR